MHDIPAICDEVRALREENERLRTALREIVAEFLKARSLRPVYWKSWKTIACAMWAIARAALADKEGE